MKSLYDEGHREHKHHFLQAQLVLLFMFHICCICLTNIFKNTNSAKSKKGQINYHELSILC